ncbi:MAG: HD family phosphohydrolase [Nitrospirae bacterium CG_4_10_14_0_8_um_filter_41_23]|nr:HD domain-containing protein [Nitrospirota bacterium]OIP58828.1 MAG: HD family phosphohydrolase [Nitrospirae bacterium CG2_30_41_42]PIQ95108.1 MAG: HD family phosphohydrolase [Nitrospirae bacterium CG11_big_fil_rev_8_21_14_0_20_41_14]PIV41216.1 MAG: HD family phosphohydrolase [Nitrospirae bacterium CG02_land_8_20_14_3_00_41_53]PIW88216.1 MAG: HD family phosphohydrolase [Nitrospirae bacterium CG_4_8_14_3_um_filter_41_47]PIY86247.1 MAG: HD family phosphohydrolase [Nitrospirae bacterium CG_4_1
MTKNDLNFFKKWFSDYCKSFYSSNIEDQKNICLKEQHTFNVCKNIIEIAKELSLPNDQIILSEAVAIFHDIGRFPQYAKYKTFRDNISVNHGLLGTQTLLGKKILQNLPDNEQELIIRAVKFHNAFSIPKTEKKDIVFFIKLIRDADKLDIWRVFIEYYESPDENRASAVGLGLPDIPEYSDDVISCLYKKHTIPLAKITTLNDFKLLQLSWIYDLNFKPSFRLLLERDYIDRIIAKLPQTEEIQKASFFLKESLRQRLKNR